MPKTCANSKYGTWYDRVDEALKTLTIRAQHTNRTSAEGQRIEELGCILSGRSSWWPSYPEGAEPIRDLSPFGRDQLEQHPYLEQPI